MTYIPDCRTDENYNEKYLNDKDKEFVAGFDWATEQMQNLYHNLDTYERDMNITGEDMNIIRYLKNHKDTREKFFECLADWIEMARDEMITSMIDNMDDEEYERIRAAVDKESEDGKTEG